MDKFATFHTFHTAAGSRPIRRLVRTRGAERWRRPCLLSANFG